MLYMEEIEVPCYFLCPISMEVMRDPVTISTGITYDRHNIEKWIFSCKHTTCPVTNQDLKFTHLTPNDNLRRLIQSWCMLNSSSGGIQRMPTPKPQVQKGHVLRILKEAQENPDMQVNCLRRIRSMARSSESNKKCLESAGVVDFLATIMTTRKESSEVSEALNTLFHLNPSDTELKKLINLQNDHTDSRFLNCLVQFLNSGHVESRTNAITLMRSALKVADPGVLACIQPVYIKGITCILNDRISQKATKQALKLLVELCPWGRNRIKASENGAVFALIELLLDTNERRVCELALTALDHLCTCAEGRSELLSHGGGIAIVSKKILRVSHVASDRAVRILCSISKFLATCCYNNNNIVQEMLKVGVVTKLCLVLQVDVSPKTKEKTKGILRLHSRVWKDSSCIPPHLLSSYP